LSEKIKTCADETEASSLTKKLNERKLALSLLLDSRRRKA